MRLGMLPEASESEALGVSEDGSVVVGRSSKNREWRDSFRWTEATGMVSMSPGSPSNLISSMLDIRLTSLMMFLSCGAMICPPSSQYTLYPLYSLGLWEAVITTPDWQENERMA